MHPASVSSAISVSRSPASPTVKAPTGNTCDWFNPLARCLSISTRPGSSSGGSVSGGQQRLVTPPATAAAISDSSVALYSKPGSRNRAARSMKPGQTILFAASITRLALNPSGALPTPTTFPAAMNKSCWPSILLAGSIRRPFLMWIFTISYRPVWTLPPCARRCRRLPGAGSRFGHRRQQPNRFRRHDSWAPGA